ncbi:hypothetical protein DSM100238_0246 [Bifidobacterium apri]|uniref:Uncharacterized protein n=1 Tax=Bifidobacterium apri TaxID=1769423 RepID=A0A6A2W392_9BIFI|nr:hypothetical protein DSM100238_0246 [Bifidobacterium apri]
MRGETQPGESGILLCVTGWSHYMVIPPDSAGGSGVSCCGVTGWSRYGVGCLVPLVVDWYLATVQSAD